MTLPGHGRRETTSPAEMGGPENAPSRREPYGERTVKGLHESLLPRVLALVERNASVLDVGCGSGAWLWRLSRSGFKSLTGMDLSRDEAWRLIGAATFVECDINRTPWDLPGHQWDFVTAIEVIEHLPNVGEFLCELARVLSDDGYALITTPNIHSIASRIRFLAKGELGQFDEKGDPTHLCPMLWSTFPRLCRLSGLEPVEFWGYPEDGTSLVSRRVVNLAAKLLRRLLPEPVPGDIWVSVLRKARENS